MINLRRMVRADMPAVTAIEEDCYAYDAWVEKEFIDLLRHRLIMGKVAELDGKVAGYILYKLYKRYIGILNIAVGPAYRNNGLGTAMLDNLQGKLDATRRFYISTAVSENNLAAHIWFRNRGWRAVEVLPGYWCGGTIDAYRFVYELPCPQQIKARIAGGYND